MRLRGQELVRGREGEGGREGGEGWREGGERKHMQFTYKKRTSYDNFTPTVN